MQAPNKKAAPFSFHRCVLYLSSLSLISQWILRTRTFISSHVVMVVIVLGAPSGKRGDWDEIKSCSRSSPRTMDECCVLKALFSLAWRTKMSSVFGTGQSMNYMAWRLVKLAKFELVLTNTHMLKHQESSGTEFQRYTVAHNCYGKRINLTVKRKTSRQKE